MGIFSVYPGIITFPADFPIQRYGGRYNGKRHSACLHGKRPAAFRNLCQIGHSNRFPLATFASCPLCPPWKGIVKISRKREAARLQTKGKRIETQKRNDYACKKNDNRARYEGWTKPFPTLPQTGSVRGMRKLYYGSKCLLVRCGDYIYNVSSEPHIYYQTTF